MENCVYVLDTDMLSDESIFTGWYGKMTRRRKQKVNAFRFDKDKRLCLGAGILLTLALNADKEPECELEGHGKPYIPGSDVCFNLSHSGTLAVCAVSDKPVGVDIQQIREFRESLIRFVFQPEEEQRINSCETPQQKDRLCTRLWTVKESVLKYLGTGVSLAPGKIRVDIADVFTAHCGGYELEKLHFTNYDIPGYELTVCSGYERFTEAVRYMTL